MGLFGQNRIQRIGQRVFVSSKNKSVLYTAKQDQAAELELFYSFKDHNKALSIKIAKRARQRILKQRQTSVDPATATILHFEIKRLETFPSTWEL